jgi:hypothetical protein
VGSVRLRIVEGYVFYPSTTTDQQIGTDLLTETRPPTSSDLVTGINRVEGMLSDTIKVCEASNALAGPHRPLAASWLGQRSSRSITLHEAKDLDRIWTQDPRS